MVEINFVIWQKPMWYPENKPESERHCWLTNINEPCHIRHGLCEEKFIITTFNENFKRVSTSPFEHLNSDTLCVEDASASMPCVYHVKV